jgi:sn-glycerol 3-phosphate transport system ATP-binding protein
MADIDFRKVRKSYGRTEVVHGVDLSVKHGEFLVILGPSGCGKSTLLRMVAGLETITMGEIAIGGAVVNRLEPRQRGCAMVFQNYALYPHMTVAENIGYALKVAGRPKAERDVRVGAVAATLGLTEFLNRKPGQLSGGQRQRVAMGRAMIREPKVFLYDEPLSNLDAKLRVAMRIEIRKLHQKLGTTTLFVTHDQVEAMTLADRIVVMNKGTVEQVCTPAGVYGNPSSTFVASFVGVPGMNLVPGVLDDARNMLVLAGGHEIALERVANGVRSQQVIAGVRAEAVSIAREGAGLRGRVQFVEQLGPASLIHTAAGDLDFVASTSEPRLFAAGDEVVLNICPSALYLFDPSTGRRIEQSSNAA